MSPFLYTSLPMNAHPAAASRAAGPRGPHEAAPQQKAGAHGGPGSDADTHHRAALPTHVQQGTLTQASAALRALETAETTSVCCVPVISLISLYTRWLL